MKINSATSKSVSNNPYPDIDTLHTGMNVKLYDSKEMSELKTIRINGKFMDILIHSDEGKAHSTKYYSSMTEITVEEYDRYVHDGNDRGFTILEIDDKDQRLDVKVAPLDDIENWGWITHKFIRR